LGKVVEVAVEVGYCTDVLVVEDTVGIVGEAVPGILVEVVVVQTLHAILFSLLYPNPMVLP